jgi:hypothetical protein
VVVLVAADGARNRLVVYWKVCIKTLHPRGLPLSTTRVRMDIRFPHRVGGSAN